MSSGCLHTQWRKLEGLHIRGISHVPPGQVPHPKLPPVFDLTNFSFFLLFPIATITGFGETPPPQVAKFQTLTRPAAGARIVNSLPPYSSLVLSLTTPATVDSHPLSLSFFIQFRPQRFEVPFSLRRSIFQRLRGGRGEGLMGGGGG